MLPSGLHTICHALLPLPLAPLCQRRRQALKHRLTPNEQPGTDSPQGAVHLLTNI